MQSGHCPPHVRDRALGLLMIGRGFTNLKQIIQPCPGVHSTYGNNLGTAQNEIHDRVLWHTQSPGLRP